MLKDENQRLSLEQQGNKEKLKDNLEKIKLNKQLPYLVGNVVEILDQVPEVRRAVFGASWGCPSRALFAPTLSVGPVCRALWARPSHSTPAAPPSPAPLPG